MSAGVAFLKGHGTENDFLLVPAATDPARVASDPVAVRAWCDRRAGVGADGVIRVVRTGAEPAVTGLAETWGRAAWFMDYRNADGSVAQMCGNGIRVMARYLDTIGELGGDWLPILTRGGLRAVRRVTGDCGAGDDLGTPRYAVRMGPATVMPHAPGAEVTLLGVRHPAAAVAVPNPHAVVMLDLAAGLDLLEDPDLFTPAPRLSPSVTFPDGANVEVVARVGPRHVRLRVFERGVGETRSCGTGVCAAAWVAMGDDDAEVAYRVDVPGGSLTVAAVGGELELTGPAVLVAEGALLTGMGP